MKNCILFSIMAGNNSPKYDVPATFKFCSSIFFHKPIVATRSNIDMKRKTLLYTVKRKRAMHTKYGVLRLSRLEHPIWREVTPNFWCVFYAKLGVLSHQPIVLSH